MRCKRYAVAGLLAALAACAADPQPPADGGPPGGESAAPPATLAAGLADAEETVAGGCTATQPFGKAVLCVDGAAAAEGNGAADNPFRTIQGALEMAKDGDEVRVAAGTYPENPSVEGKAVRLLGGFSGGGEFKARRPAAQVTTIAGQGGGATVTLIEAGHTVVDGFRVTGGTGSEVEGETFYRGGGFMISGGEPTIGHNLIEDNDIVAEHGDQAEENIGAAIFAEDAVLTIRGNAIRGNTAGRGAVATWGGKLLVEGNLVQDNLAIGDHGGGLYLAGPDITVVGNHVRGNRVEPRQGSGGWGGGILIYDVGTRAALRGNVVADNFAAEIGSGTFIDDGAEAVLRNELIASNRCGSDGGAGLYVDGLDEDVRTTATVINCTIAAHVCAAGTGQAIYVERADVTVRNSVIWDAGEEPLYVDDPSSLKVSYSLLPADRAGTGNVTGDPGFADAEGGDFHLRSTAGRWDPFAGSGEGAWVTDAADSPGIDAGDPGDPVDAEPAPNGGRVNLGAFGGTVQASKSPGA